MAELKPLVRSGGQLIELTASDILNLLGRLIVPVGSAGDPSIYGAGGANTGMFFPATDEFAFSAGGSEVFRVNGNNIFLIGKSANGANVEGFEFDQYGFCRMTRDGLATLWLNRLTSDGQIMSFRGDNTERGGINVTANALEINGTTALALLTGGATRATIDSSGNVLVGKTSSSAATVGCELTPSGVLRATAASSQTAVFNRTTTTGAGLVFRYDNSEIGNIRFASTSIAFNGENTLVLETGGAEAARIDSSGNVLVGKTSQNFGSTLGIELSSNGFLSATRNGNIAARFNRNTDDGVIIDIRQANTTEGDIRTSGGSMGINATTLLNFLTGGTERARIDSSGNVLVGKTSSGSTIQGFEMRGGTAAGEIWCVTNGTQALYLNRQASDGYLINFARQNVSVGSISVTPSGTAYNTSSDYRLKEDIQAIATPIEKVKQLKPVNFAWKADGSRVDGFIAHELAEVIPEAVTGEKDAMKTVVIQEAVEAQDATYWTEEDELPEGVVVGDVKTEAVEAVAEVTEEQPDYQGIDQSKIVPLLTSALQEAIGEIESLKARITALESA